MIRISLIAALTLVAFNGCSIKEFPTTQQIVSDTNLSLPAKWDESNSTSALSQNQWIDSFNDTQLRQLVDEALAHNIDLKIAASRVEQASSYVTIAGGSLAPSINAVAGISSKHNNNGTVGLDGWGINASWEADIWGRVRYGARSAESAYASVEADREFARQSIAALVAKGWFAATEAQLQQEYLDSSITYAKTMISLSQHRLSIGIGNESDLLQAQNTLLTLQDQYQQASYARSNALRSLELLLGRYPHITLSPTRELQSLAPVAENGVPSELLERRADIVAARYRLLAAFDRTNEAGAARLPRLTLNATVSDLSSNLFVLQNSGVGVGLGGSLMAPIFNNGALKAQEELRLAEQKEAQLHYQKCALNAFYEVENALSSTKNLEKRESILNTLITQSKRSLELEASRYSIGSRDMRSLTNAQLALIQSKLNLLRVQSELRIQRANLYLALGGGL